MRHLRCLFVYLYIFSLWYCVSMAGKRHQSDPHWVSSVTQEQRGIWVLYQCGSGLLQRSRRSCRRPTHTNQRPSARADSQQTERHRWDGDQVPEKKRNLRCKSNTRAQTEGMGGMKRKAFYAEIELILGWRRPPHPAFFIGCLQNYISLAFEH